MKTFLLAFLSFLSFGIEIDIYASVIDLERELGISKS